MSKQIDFKRYAEFVDAVTSDESKDFVAMSDRLVALDRQGINIERLLTGAVGLSAEGGELMGYVMQVLMALNVELEEIIEMNVEKLVKRYPGGEFDPYYSENRQAGDL
jgi:hypothetical protein